MRRNVDNEEQARRVAAVLQQLRSQRDWSQAVLARRAGVGIATVARIEGRQVNARTGKVDIPKSTTLRKLAAALGDGSAERAREATEQLFAAAGYATWEPADERDAQREIARLRERVEALERRIPGSSVDIEQRLPATRC